MERASLPQLQFDPSRLWRAIHVPEPSRATTIHTAPPTGYLEECDRERRDGPSSKPLVTIYRSTRPNQTGSVMKENTRVLFKQKPIEATNDPAEPEFGVNEDLSLTGKGERRKELLIFVRRGGRVDYQEKENSHFISEDIRRGHPGMSWCELRNGYTSDDSWDVGIRRKREAPLPDSYDDANDFVWYHH